MLMSPSSDPQSMRRTGESHAREAWRGGCKWTLGRSGTGGAEDTLEILFCSRRQQCEQTRVPEHEKSKHRKDEKRDRSVEAQWPQMRTAHHFKLAKLKSKCLGD